MVSSPVTIRTVSLISVYSNIIIYKHVVGLVQILISQNNKPKSNKKFVSNEYSLKNNEREIIIYSILDTKYCHGSIYN